MRNRSSSVLLISLSISQPSRSREQKGNSGLANMWRGGYSSRLITFQFLFPSPKTAWIRNSKFCQKFLFFSVKYEYDSTKMNAPDFICILSNGKKFNGAHSSSHKWHVFLQNDHLSHYLEPFLALFASFWRLFLSFYSWMMDTFCIFSKIAGLRKNSVDRENCLLTNTDSSFFFFFWKGSILAGHFHTK